MKSQEIEYPLILITPTWFHLVCLIAGMLMLTHHAISIFGNWLVLYRDINGTEMIATIFGSELTNPLLQARWFLRETGQQNTWYGELNDGCFILLFGLLRIVIASNLIYSYLNHPRPDWIARTGGTLFYIISWVFWLFIFRYAFRKYSKIYHKMFNSSAKIVKKRSSKGEICVENNANGRLINGHTHSKSE